MTDKQAQNLARYIVEYIDYELTEYGREFNPQMIQDAIQAYQGGAA
jgi:hypothetical protein